MTSLRRLLASLALAACLISIAAPVVADEVDPDAVENGDEVAASRAASFQAVTGAQQEDVPGGPLLVAAYGAVLVLVVGYVVYLGSLTSGASRDLDRLEKALEARKPDFRKSARGDDAAEPAKDASKA